MDRRCYFIQDNNDDSYLTYTALAVSDESSLLS